MYLWDSFAEEPNFLSCQMSTSCRLSILFIFLKSYGLSFFVEVRLHCGHFQESYLKVGLSPSKKIFICFIESPLKMMKNVFFHLQSSFRSQDIYVFVTSFWSCRKYGLIKKVRLTSKSWRHSLVYKQLQYSYCPISRKVKATRQWNFIN